MARQPKAIRQRAELEQRIADLTARRHETNDRVAKLNAEVRALGAARKTLARKQIAEGSDQSAEAAKIAEAIAAKNAEAEHLREVEAGIKRTIDATRVEIRRLLARDPGPFIDEAEGATKRADDARARAIAAVREARAADDEARRTWGTLGQALAEHSRSGAGRGKLGPLPERPYLLENVNSRYGLGSLRDAKSPRPAFIDKPEGDVISLMPHAVRRALGITKPTPTPPKRKSILDF